MPSLNNGYGSDELGYLCPLMLRFYFDTADGEAIIPDDVGVVFPSIAEARAEAQRLLPDIARESSSASSDRVFTVVVRQSDQVVFRATLTLRCTELVQERLEPPAVAVLESIPTRASVLLHEHGLAGALEQAERRMRERRMAGDLGGAMLWGRIAVAVLNAVLAPGGS